MANSLEQILGAQNLTGYIQSVKSGVPRLIPDAFFNLTRDVISDYATYRMVKGTRRVAQTGEYGGPSKAAPQQDVSEVPVKLIHAVENQQYKQTLLQNLQGFGTPGSQKMAEDEVERQTVEFKRRLENLRTMSATYALIKNKIWLKGDGTFLPSSSGAVVTIDYQVPSAQNAALSTVVSGAASWATSSTDIIGAINSIKNLAAKKTGFPLKYAFYGPKVVGYLLGNTNLQTLIARNPNYNSAYLNTGDIPGGFLELNWIPLRDAFYEDGSGTNQTPIGDNQVIFTPDITTEWYEMLNGSYLIPENTGVIGGDAMSVLGRMQQNYGAFSYAVATTDPISIKQVCGDTFLPVIKNPNVIWNVTDVTA